VLPEELELLEDPVELEAPAELPVVPEAAGNVAVKFPYIP
jgi:hypothetical protein